RGPPPTRSCRSGRERKRRIRYSGRRCMRHRNDRSANPRAAPTFELRRNYDNRTTAMRKSDVVGLDTWPMPVVSSSSTTQRQHHFGIAQHIQRLDEASVRIESDRALPTPTLTREIGAGAGKQRPLLRNLHQAHVGGFVGTFVAILVVVWVFGYAWAWLYNRMSASK